MKIALAHFRVNETDGVSLEMEKWKIVFEEMGHEVVFLSGNFEDEKNYMIEELNYTHPLNNKIFYNAYQEIVDYSDENSLKEEILQFAKIIEEKLINIINTKKIDLLIPNNLLSLGWGLSAGIAFSNAIKKTGVKVICHHHDFYWEREKYSSPTCQFVKDVLEEFFPPNLPNVHHVVINKIAQKELWERRGIKATIIPNVFNFDADLWEKDEYNSDFLENHQINDDDIVILQATRIVERKAIELGIDVVHEIQNSKNMEMLKEKGFYNNKRFKKNPRILYLLAGMPEADYNYIQLLKNKAKSLGVELRFINENIGHSRKFENGRKIYSLWDAYVYADIITYPSILEGWGNQLLETIFAKKPAIIYEYPVFKTDIEEKGFSLISLGDTHRKNKDGLVEVSPERVKNAAAEAVDLLTNPEKYYDTVERNFLVGKKFYSYGALKDYLKELISML